MDNQLTNTNSSEELTVSQEENAPNIFLLLGIDPDQPWNQADFDRLIEEKRREWSVALNIPNNIGAQAKKNLGLIPAVKKIAADPITRQAQARSARQELSETKKEQLARLEKNVELLQKKGYLLQTELDQIIEEFSGVFNENEILKTVRVEIRLEQTVTGQRKPTLEPALANLIVKKLDALKKVSLYDFLGMNPMTETELLRQKASEMYKEITQKAIKSAEDTITWELCGTCFKIFESDSERAKYDETLRLTELEEDVSSIAEEEKNSVEDGLNILQGKLDDLQQSFDSKIRYDAGKEKIIDKLHNELQIYREGLHAKILRPVFLDLIAMHDDLSKLLRFSSNLDQSAGEVALRLRNNLASFQQSIEDVLEKHGVQVFTEIEAQYSSRRQRVLRIENTDEAAKDLMISERISKGFEYDGKVLRPEIVVVYKFVGSNTQSTKEM